ncbi:MAG: hypothetical protein ACYST9_00440, partial [Planctomycetota bacterium]
EAIKKQFTHEEAKHLQRKARLEQMRELASEEGNTEAVERIDKLISKEQQRYDRKKQTMQERQQKILQLVEEDVDEKKGKGKGKGKSKEKSKDNDKDDDEEVEKETDK